MANVLQKQGIHVFCNRALILESGCLRIGAEDREISVCLGSAGQLSSVADLVEIKTASGSMYQNGSHCIAR